MAYFNTSRAFSNTLRGTDSYKIAKTKIFAYAFNKTRQTLLDVILQEGDGVAVIPTLAKKISSKLAEVRMNVPGDAPQM